MLITKEVFKIFAFLSFVASITALAVVHRTIFQSSGVSEFVFASEGDGSKFVLSSSYEHDFFKRFSPDRGDELFLVSSSKTLKKFLEKEMITGSISWSVRSGENLDHVLWTRKEKATELNLHPMQPILVSGLEGCCGAMTGYRLFDIETGRFLMPFNDFGVHEKVTQPFSIEIPNSDLGIRYVGGISPESTRDGLCLPPVRGKKTALVLMYASEKLKQKIQIDVNVVPGYVPSVLELSVEKDPQIKGAGSIEIREDHIQLWNIERTDDVKRIGGVRFKILIDGGEGVETLYFPVREDHLDLNAALAPSGVSIRQITQREKCLWDGPFIE